MRKIVASLSLVVTTLILSCFALLVSLADGQGKIVHAIASFWAKIHLWVCGIGVKVEGEENIKSPPYVIMCNHESPLDVPVLLSALPASAEIRFLAKRSLVGVPFLGWSMRVMGFIPVDRERRETAPAMLAQTLAAVREGGSPLVFPEQTWTLDGRLLPFQRGGFLVALKSKLPILPVGLEGPRVLLPPEGSRLRPGRVTVRIGEPIATSGRRISSRAELTAEVRAEIDRLRGPWGHPSDGTGDDPGFRD